MKLEPFTEISRGTLRVSDLAYALLPYAQHYLSDWPHVVTLSELESLLDTDNPDNDDNAAETIDNVLDALQEFAPPYCVIGVHEGDGSALGVWPCLDAALDDSALDDDGLMQVNDGAEIPPDYIGLALIVNDHGNANLVECHGPDASGEFCETVEIWSVV